MNSISAKPTNLHSLHNHHPIFSKPISSISFRNPITKASSSIPSCNSTQNQPKFQSFSNFTQNPSNPYCYSTPNQPKFQSFSSFNQNPQNPFPIKASSSNHSCNSTKNPSKFESLSSLTQNPQNPFSIKALSSTPSCNSTQNPSKFESLSSLTQNPKPIKKIESFSFSLLKSTFVAAVAATALLFSRCDFIVKPAIAVSVSPPKTVETKGEGVGEEERERELELQLESNPNDVDALKSLLEIRVKKNNIDESMSVVDRLIELEPDEVEWPLLKSHLYVYNGDLESARVRFNEIINKDPLRVEAYHGLVMAASQDDSEPELKEIEVRIQEGMKLAKKKNKLNDLRDFQLLIAQVWVIEGKYDEALNVYQELVNEEPRDFRPYLCQGIIYTLLKKSSEAEKCFEKYKRLVPKGHPYANYFDDNMMATKLFAQKLESERAGMKV